MQILLSNSQAGPGRTVKQEQEESYRNHVQTFIPGSVQSAFKVPSFGQKESLTRFTRFGRASTKKIY